MTILRSLRVGHLAGTALSGCALTCMALAASGVWARDRGAGEPPVRLAQGSSMMSTPRPAPAAPAPTAPRSGSSMMNAPRPAAPAPAQPTPPPPAQPPVAVAPVPAAPPPAPVAAAPAVAAPVVVAAPTLPVPDLGPYAVAKTATGVSASNVRIKFGPADILIPKIDINGSPLGLDEVTALLDPASATPLGERLEKLTADEILIPALTYKVREKVANITGVALHKVAAGTIGTLDVAGATDGLTSIAHIAATELDVGLVARLASSVAGGATSAGAGGKLYGTLTIEGLTGTGAAPGDTFRIARLSGREVAIKQTQHGWTADIAAIARGGPDAAAPEARRAAHAAMADLWDAVSIGGMEFLGLESTTAAGGGRGRIGRFAVTGAAAPVDTAPPAGTAAAPGGAMIQIDDFDAGSDGSGVSVASLVVGGISMRTALAAFRDWSGGSGPDEKTSPAEMRRLMPTIGSLTMSGVGINTPAGTAGAPPLHIDIATIEGLSGRLVDGLPTDMTFAIRNVAVPIPANAADDASMQLASLGYAKLTGSFGSSIAWNPATQEIAIRDLSVQAADMGTVTVRGLIGNVSPDLFNPDSALASVAAVGLTARALDISVHNEGLAERLLAREAKAQGRKPEDIRRDLGVGAAVMVPTLLGESPASRVLSQAVGRFVAKPGTLTVQLKAKQPAGYGFTDYAAAPSPVAALDQFDVTATAQ